MGLNLDSLMIKRLCRLWRAYRNTQMKVCINVRGWSFPSRLVLDLCVGYLL